MAEENDIIICCVEGFVFSLVVRCVHSSIWRHKERSDFYLFLRKEEKKEIFINETLNMLKKKLIKFLDFPFSELK